MHGKRLEVLPRKRSLQLRIKIGGDRQWENRESHGVTIRLGTQHGIESKLRSGARPVQNLHTRSEFLFQQRGNKTGTDIYASAGRKRHNQIDLFARLREPL